MSTMSAPAATARPAASSAAPNSRVAPRSKKESGVRLITAITANEPGAHSAARAAAVRAVITAAGRRRQRTRRASTRPGQAPLLTGSRPGRLPGGAGAWASGAAGLRARVRPREADARMARCRMHACEEPRPGRGPDPGGCEECLANGTSWVHLRLCLSCGHVAAATHRGTSTPRLITGRRGTRWPARSSQARTAMVLRRRGDRLTSRG